jgi:hypothetical protein
MAERNVRNVYNVSRRIFKLGYLVDHLGRFILIVTVKHLASGWTELRVKLSFGCEPYNNIVTV